MSDNSAATVNARIKYDSSAARFPFGKNWQRFLGYLDERRIIEAEKSLCTMLEIENLDGKSFIDVGNGSGLFSLAAMRKGAKRVHSFDYDLHSVACAQELKRRYFADARNWKIEPGSVLDLPYLHSLGKFDVVYSWGVLHHTGNMLQAMENVVSLVAEDGKLFIAIYNDQGILSTFWTAIKRLYNQGLAWRLLLTPVFGSYLAAKSLAKGLVAQRAPTVQDRKFVQPRGMAIWTDVLDWLGGYPFEVAKPEDILKFYRGKGFELARLRTVGGRLGNNEFVFVGRGA